MIVFKIQAPSSINLVALFGWIFLLINGAISRSTCKYGAGLEWVKWFWKRINFFILSLRLFFKKTRFLVHFPPLSPSISLALCHVYLSLFISLFYIYLSIDLLAGPSRKILLTIYSSDFLSVFHYHISYKPIDLSWYIPNKMSPISCPICPFKLLLRMHYGKPCLQSI